ncbi:TPA: AraC family transcriptional regulator [Klebsiella pneumoniae]
MIMAGAKSEMPGSIDKAPRHDEATGWSSTAISYQRGEADPPHHHVEGQLLFATRGVMLVQTESDRWVIPPQRALWLPPLHIHSYHLLSQTDLRAIYFSSSLIAECTSFTKSQQVHVITAPPLTMALPMPNDERLFSAARSLLVNQRWEASLSELAFMSAMSERTFSRLFMKDTGFSFRTWKQRARICASLDLLANGVPIKQVAYQLGFSCPAAFTAAFRCILGATPRDYVP